MKQMWIIFSIALLSSLASAQSGWYPLPDGPISKWFKSIYFINADTGFVCAEDIGCFRTSDGGNSWHALGIYGSKIKFFNNNKRGFLAAGYETTDHGLTWNYRTDIYGDEIEFPSDSVGYTIGLPNDDTSYALLGKTTDGGKTWTYKKILKVPFDKLRVVDVRALAFRDDKHGFVTESYLASDGSFGDDAGFYTSDGGETWVRETSADERLFLSDSTWLITWLGGGIYKSNDDFVTDKQVDTNVVQVNDQTCRPAQHLCKTDSTNVSALNVASSSIFRSADGGESWYAQLCHATTVHVTWNYGSISTPTKLVGYAVGIDTQIYKTTDGGGPPYTSSVSNSSDCGCELKVSPNPAQNYVLLDIAEATIGKGPLEVFDALGRSVAKEVVPPQTTSYRLDVRSYPAGVYYARIGTQTIQFVKQ